MGDRDGDLPRLGARSAPTSGGPSSRQAANDHGGRCKAKGFRATSCHSKRSEAVLEERCLGQTTCMFIVTDEQFGVDPCPGKQKMLAARLACGDHVAAAEAAKEAARIRAASKRLGAGWRFIATVVFFFMLYCACGIAYSVRKLGVPLGVGAIPHLEMWKDLPFLVRDGIIFSVDTLKSKARQQYDPML